MDFTGSDGRTNDVNHYINTDRTVNCEIWNSQFTTVSSTISLQVNSWYHIVLTYQSSGVLSIYINGVLSGSGQSNAPACVNRTSNFLGASNGWDPLLSAILGEVKIYQGAMSASDILKDYVVITSPSSGKAKFNYEIKNYSILVNFVRFIRRQKQSQLRSDNRLKLKESKRRVSKLRI